MGFDDDPSENYTTSLSKVRRLTLRLTGREASYQASKLTNEINLFLLALNELLGNASPARQLTQLNHYLLALLGVRRFPRAFLPLAAPPVGDFACGLEPESAFVTRPI
jgi:hypothetical protein